MELHMKIKPTDIKTRRKWNRKPETQVIESKKKQEIFMNEEKRFFISFIEEGIMNPKYYGYTGGRIEVYDNEDTDGDGYAIEEIRFFCPRTKKYDDFRDAWDFQDVTEKQLNMIRRTATQAFLKYPKEESND